MFRFLQNRSGNFATMFALLAPVLLLMVGFSIDVNGLYLQRRNLQSSTDIAALTAVTQLSDPSVNAMRTLKDNGVSDLILVDPSVFEGGGVTQPNASAMSIELGHYWADPARAEESRFVANGANPNAVRVTVDVPGERLFLPGATSQRIALRTSAVASLSPEAGFALGSRLASLDEGLANALLSNLLGGSVSLSLLDYRALLDTQVDLFSTLQAYATSVNLKAATYEDVLSSSLNSRALLTALAATPGVSAQARSALQKLATAATAQTRSTLLSDLLSLGTMGRTTLGTMPGGIHSKVGVLDFVKAALFLADKDRQVSINLGANLPGILSSTMDIAIGDPAQATPLYVTGETGTVIRTAQTRVRLDVRVGSLLGVPVRVPIYVEIGSAQATLTKVACTNQDPKTLTADVSAKPGLASMQVAEVDMADMVSFKAAPPLRPARILTAPLVEITGQASAAMGNTRATTLRFTPRDIADSVVKTVKTTDFTASLTSSLIGNLDLTVKVIGLGIGLPSTLKTTVAALIATATPSIDTLLNGVLSMLGIQLGEADVWVTGGTCGRPILVQ